MGVEEILKKIIIALVAVFIVLTGYIVYNNSIGLQHWFNQWTDSSIENVSLSLNPIATEDEPLIDTVKVVNPWGRTLLVQMKNEATGEWETKEEIPTKDAKEDSVKVTYPDDWKNSTYSSWRLCIAKTKHTDEYATEPIKCVTANREEVYTTCKGAIVMTEDGDIIYNKNAHKQLQNASTTKIMTAIITIENLDLDTEVKCSKNAAYTNWGNLYIMTKEGESFKAKDLLYAMIISSSNDASTALAEKIAGSEEEFAKLMNAKAKELGCTDTHFLNPHGLDTDGHYSSAYDLALMLKYAYTLEEFRKAESLEKYTVYTYDRKKHQKIGNTNELLGKYKGVLGGKTGSEDYAGYCFASVYEYKDKKYYVVELGSDCEANRWEDSKAYYKYVREYGE